MNKMTTRRLISNTYMKAMELRVKIACKKEENLANIQIFMQIHSQRLLYKSINQLQGRDKEVQIIISIMGRKQSKINLQLIQAREVEKIRMI